jgi:hypothetical protein
MKNKLSIIYVTARRQPKFEWFVETLISQYPDGDVIDQIVFIDTFIDYEANRKEALEKIVNNRFKYLHIAPKPSIWRGKHRKTKSNFFDASGSRNTGFLVAEHNHIVFIDDLSALNEGCLEYHRKAAEQKIIFCGAYDKVSDIIIENNKIKSYKKNNKDGRITHQLTDDNLAIGGGWIFGQNISFPMEYIFKINGYDEYLARRGCEDCNIGVRLELAGYKDLMFYNKNCLVIEDELLHYTQENIVDDLYCKRRWKTDEIKNENVNSFMGLTMNDIEAKHLYKDKNFYPIDKEFNLIKERDLYSSQKIFKSVDDLTYTDYDGEDISII